MSSALAWQCERCKASFFSQKLLQTHKSFFHSQDGQSVLNKAETPKIIGGQRRFVKINKEDLLVHTSKSTAHDDEHSAEKEEGPEMKDDGLDDLQGIKLQLSKHFKDEQGEETADYDEEIDDEHPISNINDIMNNLKEEEMYFLVVNDAGEAYLTTHNDLENQNETADYESQNIKAEKESYYEQNDASSSTVTKVQYTIHTQPVKTSIQDFIREKPIKRKLRDMMEFPCGKFTCDKVFRTKHERRLHVQTHASEMNYFCDICKKGFRRSMALRMHQETHNADRAFPCPQCQRVYRSERYLKKHIRTHNPSEYKYQCGECGKKFVYREWLQVHLTTHSSDAPYVCTLCGKAYRQSVGLKNHMLAHEGAKPHQCTSCGLSFRQKSSLKDHMRTHTGEKPYTCPKEDCQKSFRSSSDLYKHSTTHILIPPHHCPIKNCGKSFRRPQHLRRHLHVHEGKDTPKTVHNVRDASRTVHNVRDASRTVHNVRDTSRTVHNVREMPRSKLSMLLRDAMSKVDF